MTKTDVFNGICWAVGFWSICTSALVVVFHVAWCWWMDAKDYIEEYRNNTRRLDGPERL